MSKKKTLKTGNDGYGNKNVTITKDKHGITIEQSDSNDWGRISSVYLSAEIVDELIKFLSTK